MGAFSHPEGWRHKFQAKKKTPVLSLFLPSCVQHLKGFSLRIVEAKNNLRSLCRITTQYFLIDNLAFFIFISTIIAYFLICIIIRLLTLIYK